MLRKRKRRRAEISAKGLNSAWDAYLRGRLLSVLSEDSEPWRHPWFTQVFWDGVNERFFARVKSGLCVRGDVAEVAVSIPESEAPAATLERLRIESPSPNRPVESFLTEAPMIPIDLSRSYVPAVIPDFFRERGVPGPAAVSLNETGGFRIEVAGFQTDPKEARQLRAVDVQLVASRTRINVQLDLEGESLGLSVGLQVPDPEPSRLRIGQFESPDSAEGSIEQLLENAIDPGIEQLGVVTIYFLSPVGKGEGAEVTGEWAPFVQHHLFWNVELHEQISFPEVQPDVVSFAVPPSLGAGTGRTVNAVAQSILNDINSRQAKAFALLAGYQVEARFVTA